MLAAWLIGLACTNITSTQGDACNKGLQQLSDHVQLTKYDQQTENYLTDYARKVSYDNTGNTGIYTTGSLGFLYNTWKNKSINPPHVPTLGICNEVKLNVGIGNYGVNFKWNLW